MKALPWVLAAGAVAVAAYILLNDNLGPQADTGFDSVEDAAYRTGHWGSRSRLTGAGRNLAGRVKEGIGNFTGNSDLAGEGIFDQVAGSVKDAAGTVAQAAGQTIHDLNR
jgi:uncharacterized protein YjbJ (UPF0337 family)